MRRLEIEAMHRDPSADLMARAGEAAAKYAMQIVGSTGRRVLVLAGPGNNGGDAFEAAVHLKRAFYRVDVVHAGDPQKLRGEAASAWQKWRDAGGSTLKTIPADAPYDLIIDGLFGIGLSKLIDGVYASFIEKINSTQAAILALDVPSGLHSDTGAIASVAVRATHTITFIAHKPGLHTLDGPDHCGVLCLATLGMDARALHSPEGELLDAEVLRRLPLQRPRNFHKGKAGGVAIIGGDEGMIGAAILAGRAAIHLGAGKVFLGLLADPAPAMDDTQPELMWRKPEPALNDSAVNVVVAGPGMGTGSAAQRVLSVALRSEKNLVLDADALNLLAAYGVLKSAASTRKAKTLMTPHPAEAARLLETSVAQIQSDRIEAALTLAKKFNASVVLKGNGSVCAGPSGRWWVNTSGNPGMSSAGMGDVLSGMIGALLAQGCQADEALNAAVYLHGAAADEAVAQGIGPIGLTAQELIAPSRELLNRALREA